MRKYVTSNITGNGILKILISALFLILANISFADEMRYYDVEIIVIENLNEVEKNSENWPIQVNLNKPEKTIELGQPFPSDWLPQGSDLINSYKLLDSKSYQLSDMVEKISESKTQRVIFHTAWRQPGLDKNLSLPVYFKREVPVPPILEADNNKLTQEEGKSVQDSNASPSVLEGILRVTLARYLLLEAELTFQNKIPEIVNSDNPFTVLDNESLREKMKSQSVIHLKQKRHRIRSNELHYIDHPAISILVKMTPFIKPEEDSIVINKP